MPKEYNNTELTVGGTTIEVRHPINAVLETGAAVLVVLDPPSNVDDPRNVLAFDTTGAKRWEIEHVQSKHSEEGTPYTSVVAKDGRIVAYNWNSHRYEVDLETGAVTELGFYK